MVTVLLITRTALYYAIFVDELGFNPANISYLEKQLIEKFFASMHKANSEPYDV